MSEFKNCCVCFSENSEVQINASKFGKESILSKLQGLVDQVDWLETFKICLQCLETLKIVVTFKKLCISTNLKRIELMRIKNEDNELEEDKNALTSTSLDLSYCDSDSNLSRDNCDTFKSCEEDETVKNEPESLTIKTEESAINQVSNSPEKSKEKIFICSLCDETFPKLKKFTTHCRNIHNIPEKEIKPYMCPNCNMRFRNCTNFKCHLLTHETTRPHMCTYCGKGYITKPDLVSHEKTHENLRSFQCDQCPKSFNRIRTLRTHKFIVHGDPALWKYICEQCGKRFPQKNTYNVHMKRHNGVKDFQCHICEKCCSTKAEINAHILSHTNVCQFRCTYCSLEYKHKENLSLHLKKVHNIGTVKIPQREKKYACHMCSNKAFYCISKLNRHLKTHNNPNKINKNIDNDFKT